MRRLFVLLFILSLGATVATIYWRTYMPEGSASAARSERAPATRSVGPQGGNRDSASRRAPSAAPAGESAASGRQDLAVTISIVSSIVSALAALVQTWLTARAIPPVRRMGD